MSRKYLAHTDGGARVSNPGEAAWAFCIYKQGDSGESEHIESQGKYLGHASNNYAEYFAVIMALSWAFEHGVALHIKSDSMLVVKQVNEEWMVRSQDLAPMCAKAIRLLMLTNSTIEWVPREQNSVADALYNQILDKHMGKTK